MSGILDTRIPPFRRSVTYKCETVDSIFIKENQTKVYLLKKIKQKCKVYSYMMPSTCLTICSMAVALPMYMAWQWHLSMITLGLQPEQTRCPFPQVNIWRGGLMLSKQTGQEGIREEGGGGGGLAG